MYLAGTLSIYCWSLSPLNSQMSIRQSKVHLEAKEVTTVNKASSSYFILNDYPKFLIVKSRSNSLPSEYFSILLQFCKKCCICNLFHVTFISETTEKWCIIWKEKGLPEKRWISMENVDFWERNQSWHPTLVDILLECWLWLELRFVFPLPWWTLLN